MPAESPPYDVRPPKEIALLVESAGVTKARTGALQLLLLGALAGAFVSLGAIFSLVVATESQLGFGVTRLLSGLAFSLGLVLVVVAGAELFTGNNLIAMAWASRLVSTRELLRNWSIVYVANVIGCLGTIAWALVAKLATLGHGAVGETALRVAAGKAGLSFAEVFARGVLCNALVCLAVWLAMGGRSLTDKVVAVAIPVTAFVAMGLEHSIANWFFLPFAWALDGGETLAIDRLWVNLAASTAGNVVGGTLLVAGVYWTAYLRPVRVPGGTSDGGADDERR